MQRWFSRRFSGSGSGSPQPPSGTSTVAEPEHPSAPPSGGDQSSARNPGALTSGPTSEKSKEKPAAGKTPAKARSPPKLPKVQKKPKIPDKPQNSPAAGIVQKSQPAPPQKIQAPQVTTKAGPPPDKKPEASPPTKVTQKADVLPDKGKPEAKMVHVQRMNSRESPVIASTGHPTPTATHIRHTPPKSITPSSSQRSSFRRTTPASDRAAVFDRLSATPTSSRRTANPPAVHGTGHRTPVSRQSSHDSDESITRTAPKQIINRRKSRSPHPPRTRYVNPNLQQSRSVQDISSTSRATSPRSLADKNVRKQRPLSGDIDSNHNAVKHGGISPSAHLQNAHRKSTGQRPNADSTNANDSASYSRQTSAPSGPAGQQSKQPSIPVNVSRNRNRGISECVEEKSQPGATAPAKVDSKKPGSLDHRRSNRLKNYRSVIVPAQDPSAHGDSGGSAEYLGEEEQKNIESLANEWRRRYSRQRRTHLRYRSGDKDGQGLPVAQMSPSFLPHYYSESPGAAQSPGALSGDGSTTPSIASPVYQGMSPLNMGWRASVDVGMRSGPGSGEDVYVGCEFACFFLFLF